MRVVLDTNVRLSGLILPESIPGQILALEKQGHISNVISHPMLTELKDTLCYPKIRKRLSWSDAHINAYLSILEFFSETVDIKNIKIEVKSDPDDEDILATLIASQADYLVTGDNDLLQLNDRYAILSPKAFYQLFSW